MSLFSTDRVPIPTKRQFASASKLEPQPQLAFAPALNLELPNNLPVAVPSTIEAAPLFDFDPSDFEPAPQLDIPLVPQFEDAWCYAACGEMVINFCQGAGTVGKCEVADFIKDGDCCTSSNSICTNTGCQKDDIERIFENWDIAFQGSNQQPIGTVSLQDLTVEIDQGRNPVEVVVDWVFPGGSHALIVCGVLDDFVYILDPLLTDTGWKSYDYLLDHEGAWNWDRTWLGLRKE